MPPPIGFVLVTHHHPEQIAFLCKSLAQKFDSPPIALHHDFSKCALDMASLPANVHVVKNPVRTSWANITVVHAYLLALRLLHEVSSPDWTVSLSSSDYPASSPDSILEDLRQSPFDALMDFRHIAAGGPQPPDAQSPAGAFHEDRWIDHAYYRYLSFKAPYRLKKLLTGRTSKVRPEPAWIVRLTTPFTSSFKPYAGDAWHTINRHAAQVLLNPTAKSKQLLAHYRKRFVPEESFYQTILLNHPGLRVQNNNRRFALWPPDASHPNLITHADIPQIIAAKAHFARKFPFDPNLYDAVDAAVESRDTTREILQA